MNDVSEKWIKEKELEFSELAKSYRKDIRAGISQDEIIKKYGHGASSRFIKFEKEEEEELKKTPEAWQLLKKMQETALHDYIEGEKEKLPLEIKFTLNIPSGKMVIGNDFRNIFPVICDNFYTNRKQGIKDMSLAFAKSGLAMGFIGNTCASFVKKKADKFFIGCGPKGTKTKKLGNICTDLWWYSICDYDEYIKRVPDFDGKSKLVVKCKPGAYEFNNYYHNLEDNQTYGKNRQPYAEITWVCPSDIWPSYDYKKKYDEYNVTAEQVLHYLFTKERDFYGTPTGEYVPDSYADHVQKRYIEKLDWINLDEMPFYFTADRLMCTIGAGYGLHPNGCILPREVPMNEPEIAIPILNKKYQWYPWSIGYSTLGLVLSSPEVTLNESFARLAFNVLQCIIKHGCITLYREGGENLDDAAIEKMESGMVETSKICFAAMVLKYGCPDFCKDLEYLVEKYKNVKKTDFSWELLKNV